MIDSAVIKVKSGDGGDGLVSFRREKYIPRGGPWGGDGGKGGDIIIHVNPSLNTLNNFHRQRMYKAMNGQPGMKKLKKGIDGDSLEIKVPLGTLIYNENKQLIKDCVTPDEVFILFEGGRGGLGNDHFKSSTNRTPMKATHGDKKEFITIQLELKLLADVGLIGLPSAGKSTLINSLTRTNAKTAPYQFTTLEPNLGVLQLSDYISNNDHTLVLADIPGLIEGASEGKGLGFNFLKHIERSQILIHLIDGSDIVADTIMKPEEKAMLNYQTIQTELRKWDEIMLEDATGQENQLNQLPRGKPTGYAVLNFGNNKSPQAAGYFDPKIQNKTSIIEKPQIVIINKADIPEVIEVAADIIKEFQKINIEVLFVSAAAKTGLKELVSKMVILSTQTKKAETEKPKEQPVIKIFTPENLPNRRIIENRNKLDKFIDNSNPSGH